MIVNSFKSFITNRILEDTIGKSGSFYISSALLTSEDDDFKNSIDDIEDYTRVDDIYTNIEAENAINFSIQASLDDSITYNRIYLINKDDLILYALEIEEIEASEIMEDGIFNLDDIEVVLN